MNIRVQIPAITTYSAPFRKREVTGKTVQNTESDRFELSVGYVNDIHGQTNNMLRILSGLRGDLKLSGGDNTIGDESNKQINRSVMKFLNMAGIKATALGNHELDTTQLDFVNTASEYNGAVLAANLNQADIEKQSPEDIKNLNRAKLGNIIKNSVVTEVKGEKVGLIGTAPIDLKERITHPENHSDCKVEELGKTIELVQKEADDMKKQGINKVFLLSHLGHETDKIVAQKTEGIDVIVGGHTHELLKDIREGENLFYSKTGEPVIITEAGKNGKNFGLLNLTFDKDGIITKVQNNIADSNDFHRSLIHQYIFNQIIGTPEEVGYIAFAPDAPMTLIEENPHANFMCDAMRYEMDADISLWNNGGPRGFFRKGKIDSREVKDIAPFYDHVSVADVSEKKIVNMFKRAVETTYKSQGYKPGLLAVSGLTYTVNPAKGKLVGMAFVDKEGREHKIDINNPKEDKTYKVACDSFMMSWGGDYDILAPKEECTEYDFNKDFLTCEYIKHLNKPIIINQTGRIKYVG